MPKWQRVVMNAWGEEMEMEDGDWGGKRGEGDSKRESWSDAVVMEEAGGQAGTLCATS